MPSHSTRHLVLSFQTSIPSSFSFSLATQLQPKHLPAGFWSFGYKTKRVLPLMCSGVSRPDIPNNAPFSYHIVGDDTQPNEETPPTKIIKQHVDSIKSMISSVEDGEINISAYDTAWVALVEDINGTGSPQFPSGLKWIANNQLEDGSWGYEEFFSAYDRIISTLACVIALKTWNLHPNKCDKGMRFLKENLNKLEDESGEHRTIGFEVTFSSLLEIARGLNLEVPDDCPMLHAIYDSRNLKFSNIPMDILHNGPTSLLHSLEGMEGLDWEKLLKLQSKNGSFLFSPASTAYALQQTKDPNCMSYLSRIVHKFNGVPNVYPVDLFERNWAVDRLQRLGLSRYFEPEIKECIRYVSRYWTEKGISWARDSELPDLDDTAMGFRLLRLHGHTVSAEGFEHFKKGGEFFGFLGESNHSVTAVYNLYRASQVAFPGEKILGEAKEFAIKFLGEKQASNEVLDKWIITKDLPGEVGYALDIPWYASLPRLETRYYIEQYGGEDDVWIGKTLYSMSNVNNNVYLELAKLDYNDCRALHLKEWDSIQKWYEDLKLGGYGPSQESLLTAYFVAAASIFEPERANERLAWTKTAFLVDTIVSCFKGEPYDQDNKEAFVDEFKTFANTRGYGNAWRSSRNNIPGQGTVKALLATLSQFSSVTMALHGQDITESLSQAWEKWLVKWQEKGARYRDEAELLAETINQTAGLSLGQELLSNTPEYEQLFSLTNKICNRLRSYQNQKNKGNGNCRTKINMITPEIESYMQQLVELVLEKSSDDTEFLIKQTFFTVARSFYYSTYCGPEVISHHINKVLFQRAAL